MVHALRQSAYISVGGATRIKKDKQKEDVPSYGLLVINHAYNEGKITFKEWLELSKEWAERVLRQYGKKKVEDGCDI